MAELQRKKSIGSGNMSTPATTSSNASSSGYGYAPLYEALGLGSAPDPMFEAMVSTSSGSSGQPTANSYRSPTDTTGMTNAEIRAAAEAAAVANPFSIGGVDIGSQALGFGVSNLLSGAIGGIPGLLLGAVASRLARRAYEGEIRNQQTENFFNIIAQIDTSADLEGRAGSGRTEIDTTDPHNQWIANNVVITQEASQSDSSTSHNGDGTGQYGYNNPASSYASNRGNSSSSGNYGSSTGGYASDGSTSDGSGMAGGTGGAF